MTEHQLLDQVHVTEHQLLGQVHVIEHQLLGQVIEHQLLGWLVGLCCLITPGLSKGIRCHV